MIHKTAVVSPEAEIGNNVEIGPYSIIDDNVKIGDNTVIGPHVYISGFTTVGSNCKIHKSANIGDAPQDISYTGFKAYTEIGCNTVVREYATIHRGSKPDAVTRVGENCMLMAFSHIAHDCQIGNRVVIANNSQIAGHVEISDKAIISGGVYVHQFCKIGTMCMIGGTAKINQDVPPFCLVDHESFITTLNAIGMKRNGISSEERLAIKKAFKQIFYSEKRRSEAVEEMLKECAGKPSAELFINFIKNSKRGIQHVLPRD